MISIFSKQLKKTNDYSFYNKKSKKKEGFLIYFLRIREFITGRH